MILGEPVNAASVQPLKERVRPSFVNGSYVIISPCRDEAIFMRATLDSVVDQTVRPAKWVIVDDGSTDETPKILAEYAEKHDWIEIVSRSDRGKRAVGPGVVDAFYSGFSTIDPDQYEYMCKLDLDLAMPPKYFEIIIERMSANPLIATCSGKAYLKQRNGKLVDEGFGDDMSIGAAKFYRVSAFKEIGGFVRDVMWDGIDCHQCRMKGWIACAWDDDPELRFIHLRPMGSSQTSIFAGRARHGRGQYFMGTPFWYMAASALYRINKRPYVVGSLAMLWGWIASAIEGKRRYENLTFREFLRLYQWRALLVGKVRAMREIQERARSS
jgi:poly-beta-1,6-N-acetyl-D-glucosamine synthase